MLRDNNKIFELEEMLKKDKKTQINHVLQPKEYYIIMCCSRKSIILLSKIANISYFTVSSLYRLSKSTTKKFYKNSSGSTENSFRCRLYNGVQDQRHCKNLFNKTN